VLGITLLTLGVSVFTSGGIPETDWLQVLPLTLLVRGVGLDIAGLSRLAEALWELNSARQELARQAVVKERLRMARDLHDLLGHTLSLITIKSELARRLIEKDTRQAAREVNEIEHVARGALHEVREAITGYRNQTLARELEGARQILAAAGIACRIEHAAGALHPGVDGTLGWAVREGVTNAIRHSRATQCLIRITGQEELIRVEVINDGYREPDKSVHPAGSGLSGLAERVNAQGGRVEAAPFAFGSRPGFRLLVDLPIQSDLARKEPQR
jgi:two-component system sensor histidine kinase DesK